MFNVYFSIAAILLALGILVGLVFTLFAKRTFLGGMWAAILVGILGAFLGSVFWYILEPFLIRLTDLFGVVNIYPPLIASVLAVFAYMTFSHRD